MNNKQIIKFKESLFKWIVCSDGILYILFLAVMIWKANFLKSSSIFVECFNFYSTTFLPKLQSKKYRFIYSKSIVMHTPGQ